MERPAIAAGLLWVAASRRPSRNARAVGLRDRAVAALVGGIGAASLALLFLPATSLWLREKIGFASFAIFYSISPVTVPSPPPSLFDRPSPSVAAIELAVVVLMSVGRLFGIHRLPELDAVAFRVANLGEAAVRVALRIDVHRLSCRA